MMTVHDPFLWAAVSLFGLILASAVVAAEAVHRSRLLGFLAVALFAAGRVVLVLPYCPQPRLEFEPWHWIAGPALFVAGMVFASPAVLIRPFRGPDQQVALRTKGFYGWVRNPLYFGELLWCAGLALWFGSIVGLALVPVWWLSLLCLTLIEEDRLDRSLGEPYRAYKHKVRARIIPGLPL
jgi:protein-S-isoprenylcysteine O-methyltransferase Ste14